LGSRACSRSEHVAADECVGRCPGVGLLTSYCFWNITVPVRGGLALCGVHVIVVPEMQYAYAVSLSVESTLPTVVNLPFAAGSQDRKPSPPVCLTVAGHLHPPSAADVQSTES
jgi:hypothetical protein